MMPILIATFIVALIITIVGSRWAYNDTEHWQKEYAYWQGRATDIARIGYATEEEQIARDQVRELFRLLILLHYMAAPWRVLLRKAKRWQRPPTTQSRKPTYSNV
jgi:uncharacterized membrane protein